jgi:hypothetical protein
MRFLVALARREHVDVVEQGVQRRADASDLVARIGFGCRDALGDGDVARVQRLAGDAGGRGRDGAQRTEGVADHEAMTAASSSRPPVVTRATVVRICAMVVFTVDSGSPTAMRRAGAGGEQPVGADVVDRDGRVRALSECVGDL